MSTVCSDMHVLYVVGHIDHKWFIPLHFQAK